MHKFEIVLWLKVVLIKTVTCVVCDHSRAHTLDDDSLTLETSSDPLADARALSVMGLVYSGGMRALK